MPSSLVSLEGKVAVTTSRMGIYCLGTTVEARVSIWGQRAEKATDVVPMWYGQLRRGNGVVALMLDVSQTKLLVCVLGYGMRKRPLRTLPSDEPVMPLNSVILSTVASPPAYPH